MITNKSITEIKEEFNTDLERGLTSEEAKERLEKYGSNALKEKKKTKHTFFATSIWFTVWRLQCFLNM
jgi:magnesium-transporting ATPase (P-type)